MSSKQTCEVRGLEGVLEEEVRSQQGAEKDSLRFDVPHPEPGARSGQVSADPGLWAFSLTPSP